MSMHIVPQAKTGGWSASGELIQNDANRQITLQVQFPKSENYTIQFKVSGAASTRTIAEITWSVEGNSVKRIVNVTNGLSVTGTGQAVRIVISDVSLIIGVPPIRYTVSLQVAPGVRANVENPPQFDTAISAFPVVVLASGFFDMPVPLDAGITSVMVLVTALVPIPDQSALVNQLSAGGGGKLYDPRQCCWVPLSPGTDIIRLLNQFPPLGDFIIFTVVFGVDG